VATAFTVKALAACRRHQYQLGVYFRIDRPHAPAFGGTYQPPTSSQAIKQQALGYYPTCYQTASHGAPQHLVDRVGRLMAKRWR
jgi:hypothetical protein